MTTDAAWPRRRKRLDQLTPEARRVHAALAAIADGRGHLPYLPLERIAELAWVTTARAEIGLFELRMEKRFRVARDGSYLVEGRDGG